MPKCHHNLWGVIRYRCTESRSVTDARHSSELFSFYVWNMMKWSRAICLMIRESEFLVNEILILRSYFLEGSSSFRDILKTWRVTTTQTCSYFELKMSCSFSFCSSSSRFSSNRLRYFFSAILAQTWIVLAIWFCVWPWAIGRAFSGLNVRAVYAQSHQKARSRAQAWKRESRESSTLSRSLDWRISTTSSCSFTCSSFVSGIFTYLDKTAFCIRIYTKGWGW